MTKTVIEAALEEAIADHLGYDKHAVEGRNRANSRNGKRSKTVLTDSCGDVDMDVPRDRDGTFEGTRGEGVHRCPREMVLGSTAVAEASVSVLNRRRLWPA
jgi:transposase-like protein